MAFKQKNNSTFNVINNTQSPFTSKYQEFGINHGLIKIKQNLELEPETPSPYISTIKNKISDDERAAIIHQYFGSSKKLHSNVQVNVNHNLQPGILVHKGHPHQKFKKSFLI